MELVTNILLIACIFILTHEPATTAMKATQQPTIKTNINDWKNTTAAQISFMESNVTQSHTMHAALFNLDCLYGWPISSKQIVDRYYPHDEANWKNTSTGKITKSHKEEFMPRLAKEMHDENDDLGNVQRNKAWHFILAVIGAFALSASLHLIVKSSKNDITEVVFFQGFGAIIYPLAGTRSISLTVHPFCTMKYFALHRI